VCTGTLVQYEQTVRLSWPRWSLERRYPSAADNFTLDFVAGGVLRTSTRPTLNRRTEYARPYEHSP